MIHVVAIITTRPGLRAQVLDLFRANCPTVLAETGCIEYGATVDAQGLPPGKATLGGDAFIVVEKWASLADVQAHATSPHMAAYVAATRALVENRVVHVLEGI